MNEVLNKIKSGLIVSCQAEGESPFNNPEDMAKFAICAWMGGAVSIRSEGVEKIKAIIRKVPLPVIGLVKSKFEDGSVRITGSEKAVRDLVRTGTHIVAIDGTFRLRQGLTGPEFIRYMKSKFQVAVMADIATFEEGLACAAAGADCLSTTLSGYTPETAGNKSDPDFRLLAKLVRHFDDQLPVIAEGRFSNPGQAQEAIKIGAWAVVVGTAITRPQTITKWFTDAIKK